MKQLLVSFGSRGGPGAQYQDVAAGVPQGVLGRQDARFDDPDHSKRRQGAHLFEGVGADGVAGDDEEFDFEVFEEFHRFKGIADDGVGVFNAVGDAGGVTVVDDLFEKAVFEQGFDDGQSADAAVEDSHLHD